MLELRKKNEKEVQDFIRRMPELFKRARTSSLKGTGYEIRKRLKKHILSDASFQALHPLRQRMFRTKSGKWKARSGNVRPLKWLSRYAQYYMVDDQTVGISLRDAKKGELKSGTALDRSLAGMLEKHEKGKRVFLTEKMREELNIGLRKARLRPMDPDTRDITIPRRPSIGPVFSSMKHQVPKMFAKKFMGKMRKYTKEGPTANIEEREQ